MRDRRRSRSPRALLVGALAGAFLTFGAGARGNDLMPIDPEGEVAARLAALLGQAPARIYPLGRGGFLHRGADGVLFCTSLESGASAIVAADASVILDVRSDTDERTVVLVRVDEVIGDIGEVHYRAHLVRPDCARREVHVLTATRDAQDSMCGRGLAIGVDRAQRVLEHAFVMENGRLIAVRLEIVEHDCASGEIRRRFVSRAIAGAIPPDGSDGVALGGPDPYAAICYCD